MGSTVTLKDLVILFIMKKKCKVPMFEAGVVEGISTATTDLDTFQSTGIRRRLVRPPYTPRQMGRIPLRDTPI